MDAGQLFEIQHIEQPHDARMNPVINRGKYLYPSVCFGFRTFVLVDAVLVFSCIVDNSPKVQNRRKTAEEPKKMETTIKQRFSHALEYVDSI